MLRRLKGVNRLFVTAFLPLFQRKTYDHVDYNIKTANVIAEENATKEETGMDRIYMMFTTDEFGTPSPEIVNLAQVMMSSMFVGTVLGGFVGSKSAFLNFVEKNDATSFTSHLDAKKQLQDKVTVGFGKAAFRWGWRLTAFTGTYTLISTVISVYRGKSGILEHVLGGTFTGMLYKINLGIRGIVVGGCLGCVLGTFSGVSIWGILKLSGSTMEEVRMTGFSIKQKRDESFKKAVTEYMAQEEPKIAHKHDAKVGVVTLDLKNVET